jgi:hypothetical protein
LRARRHGASGLPLSLEPTGRRGPAKAAAGLAAERRRFGYRGLHLLLKREGVAVNWKKLYRLYREEQLTVRRRGGRIRERRLSLAKDRDFVTDILQAGAARGRKITEATKLELMKALGTFRFDGES